MDTNRRRVFYGTAGVAAVPLAACLLMSGCTSLPKGELALDLGVKDRGIASWYGKQFHGKLAANGEVFDMTAYTAAHRKLPLGSIVRVLNLDNGKSLNVRITDRGPYVMGRMMDLSHAAARALDMVDKGTAPVQLEVIGVHRGFWPLASQQWTHLSLSSEGLFTSRRSPNNMQSPMVALRLMPHDALYVRRERRSGTVLPADYMAHRAIPALMVA